MSERGANGEAFVERSGHPRRRGESKEAMVSRLISLVQRHKTGDERSGRMIGALVRELRGDAAHGDAWFREVAALVGMCKSGLYARERLARCWSAASYDRLLRRRGPTGARIYEAHLLIIAGVTSERRRAELVERVLMEGLCARRLRAIAEEHGAEASG